MTQLGGCDRKARQPANGLHERGRRDTILKGDADGRGRIAQERVNLGALLVAVQEQFTWLAGLGIEVEAGREVLATDL